jgi:hypothetical protein
MKAKLGRILVVNKIAPNGKIFRPIFWENFAQFFHTGCHVRGKNKFIPTTGIYDYTEHVMSALVAVGLRRVRTIEIFLTRSCMLKKGIFFQLISTLFCELKRGFVDS